ncbi:hypothetical protein SNEBB_003842 [Seison nebaliae]|nr:hypothetical protein SNEBB_003842 [Seison nebaliae]
MTSRLNFFQNPKFSRTNVKIENLLICCPWSGAGSSVFMKWSKIFSSFNIDIIAIRYGNRENRMNEDVERSISELAMKTVQRLKETVKWNNLLIFGHSFGAFVAYEISRLIEPKLLILSSTFAPQNYSRYSYQFQISQMKERDLIDFLMNFDDNPLSMFIDEKIPMALLLEPARKDYVLLEKYKIINDNFHQINHIMTINGEKEDEVTHMNDWVKFSRFSFQAHVMPGGHFWLLDLEKVRQMANLIIIHLLLYGEKDD